MTPIRQQFVGGIAFGAGMAISSVFMGFAWGFGHALAQRLFH